MKSLVSSKFTHFLRYFWLHDTRSTACMSNSRPTVNDSRFTIAHSWFTCRSRRLTVHVWTFMVHDWSLTVSLCDPRFTMLSFAICGLRSKIYNWRSTVDNWWFNIQSLRSQIYDEGGDFLYASCFYTLSAGRRKISDFRFKLDLIGSQKCKHSIAHISVLCQIPD